MDPVMDQQPIDSSSQILAWKSRIGRKFVAIIKSPASPLGLAD